MKKIIISILIMSLIPAFLACSNISQITSSKSFSSKVIRETALSSNYKLYQLEITLKAGGELPIILQLNDGDKVDGFFYVEKGDDSIAFSISGVSTIYTSSFSNLTKDTPVSDRFSFTANSAQGSSYTLTLKNTDDAEKKTKSVVFLEIIYPGKKPIFIPLSE